MGTKAETIRVSARPAGFTLWTVAVSALAAAALIMSAAALTVAMRDRAVTGVAGGGIHEAASTQAPPWNAAKLDAMEGRMLAESVRINGYVPLWNAAKLDAMEGRMLAESIQVNGYTPLWNAAKLDAMKGRMLAAELEAEGRGLAG
jgi:hypothetical protein